MCMHSLSNSNCNCNCQGMFATCLVTWWCTVTCHLANQAGSVRSHSFLTVRLSGLATPRDKPRSNKPAVPLHCDATGHAACHHNIFPRLACSSRTTSWKLKKGKMTRKDTSTSLLLQQTQCHHCHTQLKSSYSKIAQLCTWEKLPLRVNMIKEK